MRPLLQPGSALAKRLRTLHKAKGRQAQSSFLVEGRKTIEHFMSRRGAPRTLLLGQEQLAVLAAAAFPEHSPPSSHNYNNDNHRENSATATSASDRAPPPSLSASVLAASAPVKQLWRAALPGAVVASSQALERCSHAQTASGFLAEFALLPTVTRVYAVAGRSHTSSSSDDGCGPRGGDSEYADANDGDDTTVNTVSSRGDGDFVPTYALPFPPLAAVSPVNNCETKLKLDKSSQDVIPVPTDPTTATSTADAASPPPRWDWAAGGLVLAGVADPGNAGTLIRTAVALGRPQVLLLDCVDVYNSKVVQSTVGALADAVVVEGSVKGFVGYLDGLSRGNKNSSEDNTLQSGESENADSAMTDAEQPRAACAGAGERVRAPLAPYVVSLVPDAAVDLTALPPVLAAHHSARNSARNSAGDSVGNGSRESERSAAVRRPWVVVGSEAHGVPLALQRAGTACARITMASPDSHHNGAPAAATATGTASASLNATGLGLAGAVGSLNASVAGAIACYIVARAEAGHAGARVV